MQMQTKPLLPVSLRHPPQTHFLSLPLARLCWPHTASSWAQCPDWHRARPALAHWTGKMLTLSPHSRFPAHPFITKPVALAFSIFFLHHSWDPHFKRMPSNQREKNNATATTAGEQIKHSHIWMFGYYAITLKAKTKLSMNNVKSKAQYQVSGAMHGSINKHCKHWDGFNVVHFYESTQKRWNSSLLVGRHYTDRYDNI